MRYQNLAPWSTTKYHQHLKITEEDEVARETALTIYLNGEQYGTIVCTPDYLEELIIGYLASEGFVFHTGSIKQLTIDEDKGFAYVELSHPVDLSGRSERFIGSCCGKSREFYFTQDAKTAKTITSNMSLSIENAYTLMQQFDDAADIFGRTGGVHQAALATKDNVLKTCIDIGRHNALDKLYGYIIQNQIPLRDKCVLFSGRISSEVVLKVSKMGIGLLLAKSAPTDLALKLAHDLQITAVGFVRSEKLNIYTHDHRIYDEAIHHDTSEL